jgi:hypothetical protein
MADCCTPGSGFPTGPQMGQIALNNPIIWEEICMIQQAILKAANGCGPCGSQGDFCTVIGGDTPMTFVGGITDIIVEGSGSTSAAPQYESQIATAGQSVFNTIVITKPVTNDVAYLLVFVNGVQQTEGSAFAYTVTGTHQITFTWNLLANDTVSFYSYATGVSVGGGHGYYEDKPAVYFQPPVGVTPLIVATGTVITNGGNILGISVTNPGLGYEPISATLNAVSPSGSGSILEPLVNAAGGIVSVNIANSGLGYATNDVIIATRAIIPNPAYTNATFKITTVGTQGEILAIAVMNPGSGYQDSVTEVKIVSTLNPLVPYPLGTGFMGTVFTNDVGNITSVIVNNPGAGYAVFPPYLVINDPKGHGAETKVILSGDSVSDIIIINPGTGYTQDATGIVFNPPTAPPPNPPADPAVVDVVVSENKWCTDPNLYYQVWAGTKTNKAILLQLNAVLSYFKSLGYTITIQTNPATGSTIQWKVCWG